MRDLVRGISGENSKVIRDRLDSIQTKRNKILAKITETERNVQLASENGNLSQVSVNLYQRNLDELNRLKGALRRNFEDIYGRVKQEYEKALLFGRRGDSNDTITIGEDNY